MTGKEKTEATEKAAITPAQLPKLGIIEEDDEFEEFEVQDWDAPSKGGNQGVAAGLHANQWEADWDDDDLDDEFSVQLRTELLRMAAETAASV